MTASNTMYLYSRYVLVLLGLADIVATAVTIPLAWWLEIGLM